MTDAPHNLNLIIFQRKAVIFDLVKLSLRTFSNSCLVTVGRKAVPLCFQPWEVFSQKMLTTVTSCVCSSYLFLM